MHDAQVLTALGLQAGCVVELATGEGKTLAAVGPAWLISASVGGAHVLTFNDYLARRDSTWMSPVYEYLGASVGCVEEATTPESRRHAYAASVTYATAKQAGFDYLRDGLVMHAGDRVLTPLRYAIIDEADSLMIDEARLPLVLAGGASSLPIDPRKVVSIVRRLLPGRHYETDENLRNVMLTDDGITRVETEFGVANLLEESARDLHTAVNLGLQAHVLLHRDVDYIVRKGRIEVVDEFTGRIVADRRWPNGLHPALEAKEGLDGTPEGVILASIPLQHFFGLYSKLSGMTATAVPATEEIRETYGIEVLAVPSHRPSIRVDKPDVVLQDRRAKHQVVAEEVRRLHASGRPVLVGTATVFESESLAQLLEAAGVPVNVLNAKNDEEEAAIIREAGRLDAVTISTNMAGRGTDIRLGGASEADKDRVMALGGLHVIGTNRHESRRIDDQLRGRAGRQGDPGTTQFFMSPEDDIFVRYGFREAIWDFEHAQRVVEGQNAEIRRTLLRYSSIVEQQRQILGRLRESILLTTAGSDMFSELAPAVHRALVERFGGEACSAVERRLWLIAIDRAWTNHLARLADIRENIHLHYFAGVDWFGGLWSMRKAPLDAFHEMAIEAFDDTRKELDAAAVRALSSIPLNGPTPELLGDALRGPASTWTYILSDTPFEGAMISLGRLLRSRGKWGLR